MKGQIKDVQLGTQMFEIDGVNQIIGITQINKKEEIKNNEKNNDIIKND